MHECLYLFLYAQDWVAREIPTNKFVLDASGYFSGTNAGKAVINPERLFFIMFSLLFGYGTAAGSSNSLPAEQRIVDECLKNSHKGIAIIAQKSCCYFCRLLI